MTDTEKLNALRNMLKTFTNKLGDLAAERYVEAGKTEGDHAAACFGLYAAYHHSRINMIDILTHFAEDEQHEVTYMDMADREHALLKCNLEAAGVEVSP